MEEHITRYFEVKMMLISLTSFVVVIYLAVCTNRIYLALAFTPCLPSIALCVFALLYKHKEAFAMTNIAPSLSRMLSTFYPKKKLFMTAIGWWRQSTEYFFLLNVLSISSELRINKRILVIVIFPWTVLRIFEMNLEMKDKKSCTSVSF